MEGAPVCEPCAETRRASERARYAKARAEGKLYGGRKVETRRRIGRERSRERDETRRAAGLCTGCGRHPPVEGGASCESCREVRRAAERALYASRRAAGLPSVNIRFCTGFLKRDRIEAFARHRLGLKRWHSVVGLRADEPRRVQRMRAKYKKADLATAMEEAFAAGRGRLPAQDQAELHPVLGGVVVGSPRYACRRGSSRGAARATSARPRATSGRRPPPARAPPRASPDRVGRTRRSRSRPRPPDGAPHRSPRPAPAPPRRAPTTDGPPRSTACPTPGREGISGGKSSAVGILQGIESERPLPEAPGSSRTEPPAPHSS